MFLAQQINLLRFSRDQKKSQQLREISFLVRTPKLSKDRNKTIVIKEEKIQNW